MSPETAPAREQPPISLAGDTRGRNVELKAQDPAPEATLQACRELGAVDCGLLWQRDTYFNTPEGRLKLREQRPGRSQLIHYERPDQVHERESRYRILEVSDADTIRDFLTESLGVWATITKRRRLFLWRSVRIHLDDVEGQGSFVEFEAVAQPDSDLSAEHALIGELRSRLSIADANLLAESYADRALTAASAAEPARDR
ncbi:MAG TPA: class IV adenylate cyclase [Solirubrobacteraceae bacterium]|jgi:predicted adenylyl cyclase CyaB|nr:class IV adenylate cyclase [Solirubrobacteraceae bacterium]